VVVGLGGLGDFCGGESTFGADEEGGLGERREGE